LGKNWGGKKKRSLKNTGWGKIASRVGWGVGKDELQMCRLPRPLGKVVKLPLGGNRTPSETRRKQLGGEKKTLFKRGPVRVKKKRLKHAA